MPRAAIVAVNVGHQRTTLAVSDGRLCEFTRVLGWGGSRLAAAIGRELGIDVTDGEEMLTHLSLDEHDDDPGDRDARAREAARRELHVLSRELVASLEFYQGQPDSLPIAEILVAGGTTRIPGFVAEVERLTRVRVRVANPLARLDVGKAESVTERDDLASLAVAIGLGVED